MTRDPVKFHWLQNKAKNAWDAKFSGAQVVHRRLTREDWIEGFVAGYDTALYEQQAGTKESKP